VGDPVLLRRSEDDSLSGRVCYTGEWESTGLYVPFGDFDISVRTYPFGTPSYTTTFTGRSDLLSVCSLSLQSVPDEPTIIVSCDFTLQERHEPRTSGYMVMRTPYADGLLPPVPNESIEPSACQSNGWTSVRVLERESTFYLKDSSGTLEGVRYGYVALPFAQMSDIRWKYGTASTMRICTTGYRPRWCVTHIKFHSSNNAVSQNPDPAYVFCPTDLNTGAGGKYIYLLYKRELLSHSTANHTIYTGLCMYYGGTDGHTPAGCFTQCLTEGTGGSTPYLWLCPTTRTLSPNGYPTAFPDAMSAIEVQTNTDKPEGWDWVCWCHDATRAADANRNAGGSTVYIRFTKQQ
jgi:hypothetical protein